jgi:hypothetical protein
LVLAEGYRLRFPVAGAFTVGDVVLTGGRFAHLLQHQPSVLDHEAHHAEQYAACLGLPFLPLYGFAALWSYARTADWAAANIFEVDAGLEAGGYERRRRDNSGVRVVRAWVLRNR